MLYDQQQMAGYQLRGQIFHSARKAAKMIKVPHKQKANDKIELHWKFGRFVPQLKRVTVNYCPNSGGSWGTRDYINTQLKDWEQSHPETAVYVQPRPGQGPRLVANYMNGQSRVISINNMDHVDISHWLTRLKNTSGRDWRNERLRKPWHTENPSIQGTWTPFLFKPPLNINALPKQVSKSQSSKEKSDG